MDGWMDIIQYTNEQMVMISFIMFDIDSLMNDEYNIVMNEDYVIMNHNIIDSRITGMIDIKTTLNSIRVQNIII